MIEYISEKMNEIAEAFVDLCITGAEVGLFIVQIILNIILIVSFPLWIIPYFIIKRL